MIFNGFPISGGATYASDNSKDFPKLLELVLPHSKLMFDDVVEKLPDAASCIAVGSIAQQCASTLLDGTGLSLLDPEVTLAQRTRGDF